MDDQLRTARTKWRGLAPALCLGAVTVLISCSKTPDSKPVVVPKAAGNRESTYGKAMDSAENLKAKVADYNESIEQTIDQGTKAEPPPRKPKAPETPPPK